MKVYTYSEARQQLARLLDEARRRGEIRIKRRDGTEFAVRPVQTEGSPLDVPGADTDVTREEILAAIRESRERNPGQASNGPRGE
jgi:hypothetical protein